MHIISEIGNDNIKYSFLIPVYNVEEYLGRCIESILTQEGRNCEYEVILVDDGSTDDSGRLCDLYAEQYSNIKVIHKKNEGLLMARCTGIQSASGEYLLFVDSDDYLEKDYLKIIDKNIIEYHPDILMFGYIQNAKAGKKCIHITDEDSWIDKKDIFELFATSNRYNSIWSKVVRREIVKNHIDEIYSFKTNIGEDKLQTAYLIKYAERFFMIKECLYNYMIRDDSIVHKKGMEDIYNIISVYENIEKVFSDIIESVTTSQDDQRKIMESYEICKINGLMDHIYKYNKNQEIKKSDKVLFLKTLVEEKNRIFTFNNVLIKNLRLYNSFRYMLLKKKKIELLVLTDEMIYKTQKLIGTLGY